MSNTNQGDPNGNDQAPLGCPYCGGSIEGDGYEIVLHCENVSPPFDAEPDAEPIFCGEKAVECDF